MLPKPGLKAPGRGRLQIRSGITLQPVSSPCPLILNVAPTPLMYILRPVFCMKEEGCIYRGAGILWGERVYKRVLSKSQLKSNKSMKNMVQLKS